VDECGSAGGMNPAMMQQAMAQMGGGVVRYTAMVTIDAIWRSWRVMYYGESVRVSLRLRYVTLLCDSDLTHQ
jgi:hypothetical protein